MLAAKHIAILVAGFSLAAQSAALGAESAAKQPVPPKPVQPDIKFLEYLGTVESDDENWTDAEAFGEKASETGSPSNANAKVETAKPVVERK